VLFDPALLLGRAIAQTVLQFNELIGGGETIG
jgi:hypothetical protein